MVAADCGPDGFAGASASRATPMITTTAEPMRKPLRWAAMGIARSTGQRFALVV